MTTTTTSAERQRRAALAARAREGDPDAYDELSRLAIQHFEDDYVRGEREASAADAARDAKGYVWQMHARSYGVDPADPEVLGAATFDELNRVLARKAAPDSPALAALAEHPAVKARQEAAAKAARAQALPPGADVEARFNANPDDPQAQEAYRKLRRERWY